MSDSTWQSLHYLNLLWLLVPTALLFLYARKRRASLLKRFAHIPQIATLASSVNVKARTTRAILILLAAALVIVALARPAWNKSSQPFKAQGRDVVFILDISRSMLANHRNTTRLEEAKFAIQECLATVKGDRVALIIFAGQAKIACPLTHDYAYFLARLNDVDYRSVTFGGTMLGDAIRLACNGIFKGKSHLYRDVIVITDGEDMQSNPIQSAEQLAELNARLIAVGLGDSTPTPLVITLPDGSTEEITEDGKPVMTKLDAETLQAMTEVTIGGIFIPVPSDTMLTLNDIYREHVQKQLKRDFESHSVVTYEEKFQLFLAIALILLAIARFLPDKRSAISTVAACILLTCLPIHAKSPDKLVEQANLELQKQHYDKAEALLKDALEKQPEHAIANFNYGVLHYQQKNFQDAIRSFQRAMAQVKRQDDLSQQARNKLSAQCHQAIAKASYQLAQQEQPTENTTPEQQLQNRIEQAKNAVDHFQQALKLDAHAPNGKNHLNAAKYAQKKLEQIKRELKQQQRQQDGNGDKQEGEDKNKDDKQQNDKQQGDNQQQNDKQQNDKQQGENQQQNDKQQGENQQQNDKQQGENQQQNEREQQKKDLENLEQQQRQAAQDMNNSQKSQQELNQQQQQLQQQLKEQLDKQQQSQEKNQKAEDYLKQAQAKQQEASQQLQKQDKEKAQQAQKDAADMTRMARHALDNPEPQQQPKQPEQQPEQHQDEQQPEQKKEQAQQQSDARAIDAINQENIDKKNRMKRYFAPPARQSRDW